MKLACSTLQYDFARIHDPAKGWDLEAALADIADAGFEGVELTVGLSFQPSELNGDTAARRMLEDRGLEPVSLGTPLGWTGDEAAWRSSREKMAEIIALAVELGVPHIGVATGPWPDDIERSVAAEQIVDGLRWAVAEADPILIGLEPVGGNFEPSGDRPPGSHWMVHDLASFRQARAAVGEGLRGRFDVSNYLAGGDDPATVVAALGDLIAGVHLKDVLADGRYAPAGKGIADFPAVIEALRQIGYDGWLVVEDESWLSGHGYNPDRESRAARSYYEGVLGSGADEGSGGRRRAAASPRRSAPPRTTERLRVGVVGGGLIAQTVHLPTLKALDDRFELAGVAEPSATVREALAGRYGTRAHADWRALLEEGLDAVVVCSPHATHAEITLAALDAGSHVLVEKPLCISVEDADRICARRAETGLVVQVGYMKRYDTAFADLLARLPASAADLRLVDAVTYDPWMVGPPFIPADLVVGRDLDQALVRAAEESERAQVEAAIGRSDPASVRAFSYTYLACLVHDVNLVHGVCEHLGVPLPLAAVESAHWADGKAASATYALPNGGRWRTVWALLEGLERFEQVASFYFGDRIHRLRFSSPYLRQHPTVHEVVDADGGADRSERRAKIGDHYRAELERFHACITAGEETLTPPEQARLDLIALRDAFLAGN